MTRVVAGRAGGRRISAPPGTTTRPTSDRVREAVFSTIAAHFGRSGAAAEVLGGLSFLDLYAGSAAMALEAASRGAAPVVAVESVRAAAEVARRNIAETGLGVRIRVQRVEAFLAQPADAGFDIVWADPPYAVAAADLDGVLDACLAGGWLAPAGLLVVERSTRGAAPRWPVSLSGWARRYGETTIYYAERDAPRSEAGEGE